MHRKLIDKIIRDGDNDEMECLKEILIDLIDKLKMTDHDKYKRIELKLYKMVYGHHLNEELAHEWVDEMENKDGTHGAHWKIEDTSKYAGGHDKYDWYAVLNMVYSDYYNPKFDTQTYLELANDWIDDKDVGDDKTLKYYMYVVC